MKRFVSWSISVSEQAFKFFAGFELLKSFYSGAEMTQDSFNSVLKSAQSSYNSVKDAKKWTGKEVLETVALCDMCKHIDLQNARITKV